MRSPAVSVIASPGSAVPRLETVAFRFAATTGCIAPVSDSMSSKCVSTDPAAGAPAVGLSFMASRTFCWVRPAPPVAQEPAPCVPVSSTSTAAVAAAVSPMLSAGAALDAIVASILSPTILPEDPAANAPGSASAHTAADTAAGLEPADASSRASPVDPTPRCPASGSSQIPSIPAAVSPILSPATAKPVAVW